MAKPVQTTLPLNSFTGGEISPDMWGRTDLPRYASSLRQERNFISLPQGGAIRRPGTRFSYPGMRSPAPSRLIGFEHPDGNYVIEFGDMQVRFFRQSNGLPVMDGLSPYILASPTRGYTWEQAKEIGYARSVDTLYTVHPDVPPQRLIRTQDPIPGNPSEMQWKWETQPYLDGPYEEAITDSNTYMDPSGTTGDITVTITQKTTLVPLPPPIGGSYPIFDPDWIAEYKFTDRDIGRYIRMWNPTGGAGTVGGWGYGIITGIFDETIAYVTIISDLLSGAKTLKWRLGSWSEALGYPSVVSFVEGRICYANSKAGKSRLHLSMPGRPYELFSPSGLGDGEDGTEGDVITDSHSIDITITGTRDRQSEIQWVESGRVPYIGTTGGVYPFISQGETALSPTNVEVRFANSSGSSKVPPIVVDSNPIYASLSSRKLRVIGYDLRSDGYQVPEISKLAQHIAEKEIVEMAYQQEPHSVIWCVLADGTLGSLTYDASENVMSWAQHDVTDDAEVLDIAVIQREDGSYDEVWMLVERNINGVPQAYIEVMERYNTERTGAEDAFYVDSGVTYDGSPTTEIVNLSHLEGVEVAILADGAVVPSRTVLGGKITLPYPASLVHVGLLYTSLLQTLPQELPITGGTAIGKKSRLSHLYAKVQNTLGGRYGISLDRLSEFYARPVISQMDAQSPLRNEIKRWPVDGSWNEENTIYIVQEDPLPFNLLILTPELTTGER